MRTVNITFEDEEFEELLKRKKGSNWHDFVLQISQE
jgi:hypothetical protein